jgi:hypothetical protein
MAFPSSPVNGQTTTVNGITYIYNSTDNAWYRGSQPVGNLTVSGNVTAARFFIANTGDVGANIGTIQNSVAAINANLGAYQLFANANAASQQTEIGTLTSNAATQAVAIDSINANIGAYQTFANANLAGLTSNVSTLQANAAAQQVQINDLASNANANTAAYLPTYSGNIGGTVTTASQPYVTTLANLTSFGGVFGDTTAQGNLTVVGNLTVQGNTITVGSNNLTVTDSIIDLHTPANLQPLISDDGRDIGIRFHYYKDGDDHAFFGWENTTEALIYLQRSDEINSNITGTYGNVHFGSMLLSNTAEATSTTSGALQVVGGAGIDGNLYANALYTTTGIRWAGNGAAFSSYANADVKIYLESLSNVNIGVSAGVAQGDYAVAIGFEAGKTNQKTLATAVGYAAGSLNQSEYTVALGFNAGAASQGLQAIAIGSQAAQSSQSSGAIAIGSDAGQYSQGNLAVAIGLAAGQTNQGYRSIAIGYAAGLSNQAGNSIVISANGTVDSTTAGFFVDPIRNTSSGNVLYYNPVTKEITYSTSTGGGGGGITYTAGNTAPVSPAVGDQWYYVAGDILFQYLDDGDTDQWVDILSAGQSGNLALELIGDQTLAGNLTVSLNNTYSIGAASGYLKNIFANSITANTLTMNGSIIPSANVVYDLGSSTNRWKDIWLAGIFANSITSNTLTMNGNIIPGANVVYDLGSSTNRWKDIWLAGNTIYLGAATITADGSRVNFSGASITSNLVAASGTASTSATTGALVVAGGMGISGNIFSSASIIPTANVSQNLGTTTNWWGTFYGVSTQAQYADLAENYTADADYAPGTVLIFGGANEVTTTQVSHDTAVAGVVSTNPAYLMNASSGNVSVALTGRVPCLVQGPVNKGTVLVTSTTPGVAMALDSNLYQPGCVIGKSLEMIPDDSVSKIEVVVGRF